MKAAIRARHELNPAQQAAFQQIHESIQARRFQTFLLHGVTGSRQDGGLSHRDRDRAGRGPQRAADGARDRAHSADGGAVLLALRRPRGHPALRIHRRGAHRAVAPHTLRRGQRGGGHALRRVRAGAESGPHRGGRRARRQLQAGGESALQRARRGHRTRAGRRAPAWSWARPRPAWRAATTPRRASTPCSSCPDASSRGPCPWWNSSTCGRSFWRRASRTPSRAS